VSQMDIYVVIAIGVILINLFVIWLLSLTPRETKELHEMDKK